MKSMPCPRALVALALLLSLSLGGCAAHPQLTDGRALSAPYPGGAIPAELDGRSRFREIFCELVARDTGTATGDPACGDLLWQLSDESAPVAARPPLPGLPAHLRVFVVSGAFNDCRRERLLPYAEDIARLAAAGFPVESIPVSGRSSAQANAGQIAHAIQSAGLAEGEAIMLIGYSKGSIDILQMLVNEPAIARRVVAVVSVAGPIAGSPLAQMADWSYRELFEQSFEKTCDPGDGGVVASLVPQTRRQWLVENPLPAHIRYFSIAAFPTREHLSHGLSIPWRLLAGDDPLNDGQVRARDAMIPGGIVLGYLDADHWDVALDLDRQLPYLSARPEPRHFPLGALLEAVLRYVGEDLHARTTSPN
jgi:hypothetical protein